MSVGCIDITKLKNLKKDQTPEQTRQVEKSLLRTVESFQNDPTLKKFGYNDIDTMLWIFNDKVGVPMDLASYNFSGADIKKFALGIKEFKSNIVNPDGGVSRLLKIPRRLLSKVPEAKEFVDAVELSLSHYKDNTNEPAKNLNEVIDSFTKLAVSFDVNPKDLRAMEVEYRKASHQYKKYDGKNEPKARAALDKMNATWASIADHLTTGTRNIDNIAGRSRAGELYLGLRDVLEGVVTVDGLTRPDGKTPWTKNEKKLMQNIHDNFVEIRRTGLQAALSGVNNLIRLAELRARQNDPYTGKVVKMVEKYRDIIKELEIQSNVDEANINGVDNFVHGELKDANGKDIVQRKYMPHYVLEAFEHLNMMKDMLGDIKSKDKDVFERFAEQEQKFGNVIDRLKNRSETDQKKYSLDPFYFMNKYIHDIARFNLSSNLNLNYTKAFRALQQKVLDSPNSTEVAKLAESLGKTMHYTYDAILGLDANTTSGLENLTRFITSVEHSAKMGGNIRSAIRNRLQKVYNYVQFGRKGLNFSDEFYSGANQKFHNDLVNAALKKHGITWEAMGKGDIQGVEGMTRGAVENIDPNLPGEFKINKQGQMVDATPTAGDKIARKAGEFASGRLMSGIHRRVENANRQETFKVAFALAYNGFTSNGLEYIKREMIRSGRETGAREITDQTALSYAAEKAGNYAYHATIDLHFDYSKAGKPEVLRTKAGRVFGQYQNYRFGMLDLQTKWLKDAKRAIKAGDYTGPELARMWRLANLYLMTGVASVGLNSSFGNLISNDSFGFIKQWWEFMSGAVEDERTDEVKRQMSDSFYGVGPAAGTFGGPLASDVLTIGELYDLWSLDEYGIPHMESSYDDAWKEKDDQSKLYNTMRIFNGQAARAYQYSLPQLLKGDIWQAMKIETGLYPSKWIRDARNLIGGMMPNTVKDIYNEYTGLDSPQPTGDYVSAIDNLTGLSEELGANKYKNKFVSKY